MAYKQYLTAQQIQRLISGEKEANIAVTINLTASELEAVCDLLRLSRGYADADSSLIRYEDFDTQYGLTKTHSLMDAMSHLELAFCAAEKGISIDQYMDEYCE
jgi:hypothetical protein